MDFDELMDFRNSHSRFAKRNEIYIEEITRGYARVRKIITESDLNSTGQAHGAILFAIADVACGSVAASGSRKASTLQATFHFLHGCSLGDELVAEATQTAVEDPLGFYHVVIRDQTGRTVGTASMNFYIFQEKI